MLPSQGSEAPKVMLRVRCTVKQSGCVRPHGLALWSTVGVFIVCVCVWCRCCVSISVFIVCVCVCGVGVVCL